jgi:ACS family hexuronate transporter-like MFS transporter
VRTEVAESLQTDRLTHVRWGVCALLFFATTINYIDRQVLSILKPTLQGQFGWRESDYAWIVVAFQLAYAVMMPLIGRIIDRLGTRLGYAAAVAIWSAASISHAFAHSAGQFIIARFSLGVGEAGNFPAAVRTVADWFPQEERSFATGIFNSGSNVGVIAAALIVPAVTVRWGWQAAFVVTGGLGFVWIVAWFVGLKGRVTVTPTVVRKTNMRSCCRIGDHGRSLLESLLRIRCGGFIRSGFQVFSIRPTTLTSHRWVLR